MVTSFREGALGWLSGGVSVVVLASARRRLCSCVLMWSVSPTGRAVVFLSPGMCVDGIWDGWWHATPRMLICALLRVLTFSVPTTYWSPPTCVGSDPADRGQGAQLIVVACSQSAPTTPAVPVGTLPPPSCTDVGCEGRGRGGVASYTWSRCAMCNV